MVSRRLGAKLHPHILAVMKETGEDDPVSAVRRKSRDVVEQFHCYFGSPPPFNMPALASFRSLHLSDDDPRFSEDSEIAPEGDGRVVLRVNKTRPPSRQRFSIGHEIGHTLFPDYQLAVRCRRGFGGPGIDADDLLESLCDIAAAEIVFPDPWFADRVAANACSAAMLAALADEFAASREATVRRYVEKSSTPLAAVFFSWKLKPTELRAARRAKTERSMFADLKLELPSPMLRVDYAIVNAAFERQFRGYIPKDKSIPAESLIHSASLEHSLADGLCDLEFGALRGRFSTHVLPVYTNEEAIGPTGGCSVVAVIGP